MNSSGAWRFGKPGLTVEEANALLKRQFNITLDEVYKQLNTLTVELSNCFDAAEKAAK